MKTRLKVGLFAFPIILLILFICIPAFAGPQEIAASIVADPPTAGTWATDTATGGTVTYIVPAESTSRTANITVAATTWVGNTVVLQRSYDGSAWKTVKTYTADAEEQVVDPEARMRYRLGMTDTAWTSGTITVRMGR